MNEITVEDILMLQMMKQKQPINVRYDKNFEKNLERYLRTGKKWEDPYNPEPERKKLVKEVVINDEDRDDVTGQDEKKTLKRYSIENARISIINLNEFEGEDEFSQDQSTSERLVQGSERGTEETK